MTPKKPLPFTPRRLLHPPCHAHWQNSLHVPVFHVLAKQILAVSVFSFRLFSFFLTFTFYLFVCVYASLFMCVHTCEHTLAMVNMWSSKDRFWEPVSSFHHVDSETQTQAGQQARLTTEPSLRIAWLFLTIVPPLQSNKIIPLLEVPL